MPVKNEKYELIFERKVKEPMADAYLLRHKKSGARVFIMSNDDDNKVFYIGFRTPPSDSTGVAHITEHSVLCGSRKFPLKDPFVELAKGSLNTFLNAITYPDKTVYPVASRNDQDFRNLMDVYMDAVFHPNTYIHPEIMKQEGWSYKLENADDPLEYNGVVYNEMKGAFSSPDGVLEREVMNSLFPDTAYGVESGGDPDCIPDLTYDAFLNFHRKYYHPSNSYIFLYGDMDIEEKLAWMDENYLDEYDTLDVDSELKFQKPFEDMHTVCREYPVTDDEPEEGNTYLSFNMVCGDSLNVKVITALQMVMYAIIDMQGAPLRQRLLDEGIGKDVMSLFEDGIMQPYMSISVKNSDADKKERFLEIIREEFEKAANEGIDRKSLRASLNSIKFKFKEADFGGYPKGLIYGLAAMNSWLYDDLKPLTHLELSDIYDELEADLDTDYYEQLVREFLLENTHSSLVILSPRKGLAAKKEAELAGKLAAYKASLSDEEIDRLVSDTKALAAYQEEPSGREQLETIPLLARSDINRVPAAFSNTEMDIDGIPVVFHDHPANGIAYISLIFDANKVSRELFQYLGLIGSIVSFVDTENYTYTDLNNEINTVTGGLSMEPGVYQNRKDPDHIMVLANLFIRTLYENMPSAMDLAGEVLFAGKYRNGKRLYEIIAELKSRLQMTLMSAGHVASHMRAASYFSKPAALKEQINGIEFYKFVEDLEKNFDDRKDALMSAIEELIRIFAAPGNLLISFTGDRSGLDRFSTCIGAFKERMETFIRKNGLEAKQGRSVLKERRYDFEGNGFVLEQKNEAFKTSSTVNYIARSGRYFTDCSEYRGSIHVFHTIMRYEYMWFNIRVQGGAYGCMCGSTQAGDIYFVTYRDPHIRRSNEVFENIPGYLKDFECDEREMTKYVIGTMSTIDPPLNPPAQGSRDMLAYLLDTDYEEIKRIRAEVIDCSAEDIHAIAPMIRSAMEQGNICCVGSEAQIAKDQALFATVRNLFE